jgi:hypothetical protein
MAQVQDSPNAQQIEYWNATAGETWAQFQEPLDRQIEPLGLAAIDVLDPAKGEHIIDIGCGCGQTSLALAARVGPQVRSLASTFRGPCLRWLSTDRAKLGLAGGLSTVGCTNRRSRTVRFRCSLLSLWRDVLQRFCECVHQHSGLVEAWRPSSVRLMARSPENPWMQAPLQAALPLLPPVAPPDPAAPGPFAFADASRVRSTLSQSGFACVTISPFDTLIGSEDVEQALKLALRLGPLGRRPIVSTPRLRIMSQSQFEIRYQSMSRRAGY